MQSSIHIPCWYVIIAILWSSYQGVRGVMEHNVHYNESNRVWSNLEKWIILFVHDFAFRFICTITGFIALFLIINLYGDKEILQNLSSGAAVFLVFLSVVAIMGIGGQLHYILLMGKWPK